MIRIYETPVHVDDNGNVTNPEPDVIVIDGTEYRRVPQSDGHVIDPAPEQSAYDACLYCGKPIQLDVYGSGRLATMIGRNFECYGR